MVTRRFLPFIFCLLLLGLPTALAQTNPTVAIELSRPWAAQGDTVTASVVVRNGTNIAGADIGLETDGCLKLTGREQGAYLPDASAGGFTVYDESTVNSTRLAVAITDRDAVANADDVFFEVEAEVVCQSGTAGVAVTFAELSAYVDPKAPQVELIAYTQAAGTVTTEDAVLRIVSAEGYVGPPPTDVGSDGGAPAAPAAAASSDARSAPKPAPKAETAPLPAALPAPDGVGTVTVAADTPVAPQLLALPAIAGVAFAAAGAIVVVRARRR